MLENNQSDINKEMNEISNMSYYVDRNSKHSQKFYSHRPSFKEIEEKD